MADFTKVDQRVSEALSPLPPNLQVSLSKVGPALSFVACLPALREFAEVVCSAGLRAADDPQLADIEVLRTHMVESILGEDRRAGVLERTREERNQILEDHATHRVEGHLFIAPLRPLVGLTEVGLNLEEAQREAAPAAVQVVYEPFGLWERLAPSNCRYVLRVDAAEARETVGLLFDTLAQREIARRIANPGTPAGHVLSATNDPLQSSAMKVMPAGSKDSEYKTVLGRNIDLLRLDCGWTYDDMYSQTGISKKRSIGHVKHGKGASPKNLKLYADAFAKRLGKAITVQQLKG